MTIIIREKQLTAFNSQLLKKLALDLYEILSEETKNIYNKDEVCLKKHIDHVIKFSWNCNVYSIENIQHLLLAKLKYNFDLSIDTHNSKMLSREGFNEGYRVRSFILSLNKNQLPLTRIYLNQT